MLADWRGRTESRKERGKRWALAIAVALILQIPLVLAVLFMIDHSVSDIDFKPVGIGPIAILEPEDFPEETIFDSEDSLVKTFEEPDSEKKLPDIVPDGTEDPVGQIVTMIPPEKEIMPEEARYASRYAIKVDKETKAVKPSEDQKVPQKYSKSVQSEKRPAVRKGNPDRTDLQSTDMAGTKTARQGATIATEGRQPGKGEPDASPEGVDFMDPHLAGRDPVSRYSPSSAPFASDDLIVDVDETGETNLLNTVPYRYAGFFERVKRNVRQHWDPNREYRLRDPSGEVYGHKDRYTVLRVVLDKRGYILDTTIAGQSGLPFLDNEALRAFGSSGPFLNPPEGLVKDGKIRFDFGFGFLIASSRQRFFWNHQ
jgi:outer membrane biosynthesis protein TonB